MTASCDSDFPPNRRRKWVVGSGSNGLFGNMSLEFRESHEGDGETIRRIHEQAFQQMEEADLTLELLLDPTARPMLSLFALEGGSPVAHVLFTSVFLERTGGQPELEEVQAFILAPMAVLPDYQGRNIGTSLIKEGLRLLQEKGGDMVFVLGHIDYYPRAGFHHDAGSHGFGAPYPVPEQFKDAWMFLPLSGRGQAMLEEEGASWAIRCADVLNQEKYWAQ